MTYESKPNGTKSNFSDINEKVRAKVEENFPHFVEELTRLVAIPSVSSDPALHDSVEASAQHVAGLFASIGFDTQIVKAKKPDGTAGKPAIIAHSSHIDGAPRILLYAHHDVQPAGELARWSSDPFLAEKRGDRLYGRGSSDDGAGIIVHYGALATLGAHLDVNVTLFIEGEEEIGSPSFRNFLDTYGKELESDVIIVADSNNWKVGTPALTTTLRGNCVVDVHVKVLDHAVHSGQFGGPLLDAVTIAARMIATLHDENGNVAVEGLGGNDRADVVWPENEFRSAAGVVDGYELVGTGDLAARVWTKPAINVIGFDTRPISQASNTIAPEATFELSMRTTPDIDPHLATNLLVKHLEKNVPFGAHVTITPTDVGPGYSADTSTNAAHSLRWAMKKAWGIDPVNIGVGGSIPFISDFKSVFPHADVLVTGVEDPLTNAHSEDESQSLSDLHDAIIAEALFLSQTARS